MKTFLLLTQDNILSIFIKLWLALIYFKETQACFDQEDYGLLFFSHLYGFSLKYICIHITFLTISKNK